MANKLTGILGGIQQVLTIASMSGLANGWSKQTGLNLPEIAWPGDKEGTQEKLLLGISLIIFSLDDMGILRLEDLVKEAKQLRAAASKLPKLEVPPSTSKLPT